MHAYLLSQHQNIVVDKVAIKLDPGTGPTLGGRLIVHEYRTDKQRITHEKANTLIIQPKLLVLYLCLFVRQ